MEFQDYQVTVQQVLQSSYVQCVTIRERSSTGGCYERIRNQSINCISLSFNKRIEF
jgi:hypothetical protein